MELPELVRRLFPPGAVCTFIGAGGKSTAMRAAARILSARGIRVRMTTTTRVGVSEFMGYPVSLAGTAAEVLRACDDPEPVRLIVAEELPAQGKYAGLDPSLVEGLTIRADSILLVEGDGSRRRPLKVPTHREPVIPASTSMVLALMGASGFNEPIDEEHCYNHEAAFGILAPGARRFDAACVAALASSPTGSRKGVMPGMGYHVLLNQADLTDKRAIGSDALRILLTTQGIRGSLLSLRQEAVYETTVA